MCWFFPFKFLMGFFLSQCINLTVRRRRGLLYTKLLSFLLNYSFLHFSSRWRRSSRTPRRWLQRWVWIIILKTFLHCKWNVWKSVGFQSKVNYWAALYLNKRQFINICSKVQFALAIKTFPKLRFFYFFFRLHVKGLLNSAWWHGPIHLWRVRQNL